MVSKTPLCHSLQSVYDKPFLHRPLNSTIFEPAYLRSDTPAPVSPTPFNFKLIHKLSILDRLSLASSHSSLPFTPPPPPLNPPLLPFFSLSRRTKRSRLFQPRTILSRHATVVNTKHAPSWSATAQASTRRRRVPLPLRAPFLDPLPPLMNTRTSPPSPSLRRRNSA